MCAMTSGCLVAGRQLVVLRQLFVGRQRSMRSMLRQLQHLNGADTLTGGAVGLEGLRTWCALCLHIPGWRGARQGQGASTYA